MYFSLKQKNENIGGVSFGIFSFVNNHFLMVILHKTKMNGEFG